MRLFVGNLSYNISEAELSEAFGQFGEVSSVKIIVDRDTGRSRGFGFVDMPNADEATKGMNEIDGSELGGRTVAVKEAHENTRR